MSTWVVRKRWFSLPFSPLASSAVSSPLPRAAFIHGELWGGSKPARVALPSSIPRLSSKLNCYDCPAPGFTQPAKASVSSQPASFVQERIFLAGNAASSSGQSSFCSVSRGNKEPAVRGCSAFLAFPRGWDIVIPLMLFLAGARALVYPRSSRRIWH